MPATELLDLAQEVAATGRQEHKRVFVRELSGKYSEIYKSLFSAPRIIHAGDIKWVGGPQSYRRPVMDPERVDHTQLFHTYFQLYEPGGKSGKHGHMNSAIFYILEGDGYDIHDGKKLPWHAGDACIVEPGCVHQHFNDDAEHPAKILVMKAKPIYLFSDLGFQKGIEGQPTTPVPGFEDWLPQEVIDQGGPVGWGSDSD